MKMSKVVFTLLCLVLFASGIVVFANEEIELTRPLPNTFSADCYYAKTDYELHALFAPYRELTERINLEYGVLIIPFSVYNPIFPDERLMIAEILAYVTLEEHERQTREFAVSLRNLKIRNKLFDVLLSAFLEGVITQAEFNGLQDEIDNVAFSQQCIILQTQHIFGDALIFYQNTNDLLNLLGSIDVLCIFKSHISSMQVDMEIIEPLAMTRFITINQNTTRVFGNVFVNLRTEVLQSNEDQAGWRYVRYTRYILSYALRTPNFTPNPNFNGTRLFNFHNHQIILTVLGSYQSGPGISNINFPVNFELPHPRP